MNSLKEWGNNQKVLIIIGFDLLILGVTFFYEKSVFFYFILLINIIILFSVIPIIYLIKLHKQPISPEEYYLEAIETNYMCMDESLLTKIFEIRISNIRQSVFSYLILIATFTLTIAFNPEAYNYFNEPILGVSGSKIVIAVGVIGILVSVFTIFGIDRLTLKELKHVCKTKKKLKQLKERNISSPTQETPTTNEDTHEHGNDKAFSYQNMNSANQDKTQTIKNSADIIALVEDAIKNKDASIIEKIEDKNHLKYMQKVVEVGILKNGLIFSIPSVSIGIGISIGIIAIGVSFLVVTIPIDNLSKITYPVGGVIIICMGIYYGIKAKKLDGEFEEIKRDIEFMRDFILEIEGKLLK